MCIILIQVVGATGTFHLYSFELDDLHIQNLKMATVISSTAGE